MKAYIIMPGARMIKEVEYDGSPASLIKLYPYNEMDLHDVDAENGDHMLYNPYWTDEPGVMSAWQAYCHVCKEHHVFHGVGVIVGVTADDALKDPHYSAQQYSDVVEWVSPELAAEGAATADPLDAPVVKH